MEKYFGISEAVIDLHERGFTEDFQLFGMHLFWIQRKIFLKQKDFSIAECYIFIDSLVEETIIYGVIVNCSFAGGILINHYKNYTDKTRVAMRSRLEKCINPLTERGQLHAS